MGAILVVVGSVLCFGSAAGAQGEPTTTTEAPTTTVDPGTTTSSPPFVTTTTTTPPEVATAQACWTAGVDGDPEPPVDTTSCAIAWTSGRQVTQQESNEKERDSAIRIPVAWALGLVLLVAVGRFVFGIGRRS